MIMTDLPMPAQQYQQMKKELQRLVRDGRTDAEIGKLYTSEQLSAFLRAAFKKGI
jgi:hypothetical protein